MFLSAPYLDLLTHFQWENWLSREALRKQALRSCVTSRLSVKFLRTRLLDGCETQEGAVLTHGGELRKGNSAREPTDRADVSERTVQKLQLKAARSCFLHFLLWSLKVECKSFWRRFLFSRSQRKSLALKENKHAEISLLSI